MGKAVYILKANGEREIFDEEKVKRAIHRAGIPDAFQDRVLSHIREQLHPEITTAELHRHIMEFLNRSYPVGANKFNLKQAIMELGPSGYPFEKYMAEVLSHHGYRTETNLIIRGKCVSHEVDIMAEKDGKKSMIECKFHNLPGARSDVRVALYVKSRFDDLKDNHKFNEPWVVTNTKCTIDAIAYAQCVGLKVVSWGYPEKGNIQDLVDSAHLYPITCHTSLTNKQKAQLLARNIVLSKDLLSMERGTLDEIGISQSRYSIIKQEVANLMASDTVHSH
jgi:hypothetical protein